MLDYINKGKNVKTKPLDLSNKNKCMVYCNELSYGILSYSSYIDLEKMRVVSSVVKLNEYKLLGTKSKKMVDALRLLEMPLFITLLRENNKIHSDDDVLKEELVKYVRLNKKRYIVIKEFKNRLTALREILEHKNKIQETRETREYIYYG